MECRYGVQYVKDPKSGEIKPTVSRMRNTAILADEDYRSAIENATDEQRGVYEHTAAAIADIQKEYLRIAWDEPPFDVFICYKDAGDDGQRTPDSVLAGEIYEELTHLGYRAFYSRETLRNYPGELYDAHIFAALYSAKMMLVIATRREYVQAAWVRSEWSRYLDLIDRENQPGKGKMLLPLLQGMRPEDCPQDWGRRQTVDMNALGAMNDLISVVRRSIRRENPAQEHGFERDPKSAVENLLGRAFQELRHGSWDRAIQFCERALEQDYTAARAYLGKLLAEQKAHNLDELGKRTNSIAENADYGSALDFADEPLRTKLEACERSIQKNILRARQEAERIRAEEAEQLRKRREHAAAIAAQKAREAEAARRAAEVERQRLAEEERKQREAQALQQALLEQKQREEELKRREGKVKEGRKRLITFNIVVLILFFALAPVARKCHITLIYRGLYWGVSMAGVVFSVDPLIWKFSFEDYSLKTRERFLRIARVLTGIAVICWILMG